MIPFSTNPAVGDPISLPADISHAILITIAEGWEFALSVADVNPTALEVPLTQRLRQGMQRLVASKKYEWCNNLCVLPGTESRSNAEVLRPDGYIDIPVLCIPICQALGEQDPHALIECKRIAGNDTHLCREYVVQGIDRFKTGKYAGGHLRGFMVGFVIDGGCVEAAGGVNAYLGGQSRTDLLVPVEDPASNWWHSDHPRPSPKRTIRIVHGFLLFSGGCWAPSAA